MLMLDVVLVGTLILIGLFVARQYVATRPADYREGWPEKIHGYADGEAQRWLKAAKGQQYNADLKYIRDEGFGVARVSVVYTYVHNGEARGPLSVYVDLSGLKNSERVTLDTLEKHLMLGISIKYSIPLGNIFIRRIADAGM